MGKKHLYYLCAALIAAGAALFAYKFVVGGLPVFPEATVNSWEIEARLRFDAKGQPVTLRLYEPADSTRYSVVERRYLAPGYGLTTENENLNKRAVFATKEASGRQTIYFKLIVNQVRRATASAIPDRPAAVRKTDLNEEKTQAARALIADADRRSSGRATFIPLIIKTLTAEKPTDTAALLLERNPSAFKRAQAIVDVLSLHGIPATAVSGVQLGATSKRVGFVRWIEAHVDGKWQAFSLSTAARGVPDDYLAWWRGREALTQLENGNNLSINLAMLRLQESTLANLLAIHRAGGTDILSFSLFSLPVQTQQVYRLLVMIPVGIFLLVILRNVIGIKTFGTFMPVLIALAFRETQLAWGMALFISVVGIGLLVRTYLESLKLLLVPRLAAVLICVVLIMALISIVSHKLGIDRGLSVALFPMVIMTMTIERMSIVWDERGAGEALKQAVGSLAVAVLCYAVINIRLLEHLLFTFPELLLVLLALTLLLGRYTGYRLTELKRFRVLAGGR